jgi:general secretion pathway protein D
VAHAPLRLAFDPGVLSFVEAAEGDFMSSDGSATQFLASAADEPGLVDIALSRLAPGSGVGGGGTICTVTFRVVGRGASPITMIGSRLLDASSRPVSFRRNDSHVAVD